MLKISILLNLGLLGCLVLVVRTERRVISESVPRVVSELRPQVTPAVAPEPQASPGAEAKPFAWSQIESTNYQTYIANLRGIGCPDQTIRDLITADVDSLYAPRREHLERKLTGYGSITANFGSRQALETGLHELRQEEDAVIAALLGSPSFPLRFAADSAAPARTLRHKAEDESVSVPLVFQNVDQATLKLDSGQTKAIDDLRRRFLEEVGGLHQDPNDPAYRERWQQAQPEIDNLLRGMIGMNAYQDYQLEAAAANSGGNTLEKP